MNYLLLSTIMIAAIDNTFCRGCDCCKKLCADKGSSEPCIKSDDNNTNVGEKLIHEEENTTPINMTTNTTTNENLSGNSKNNDDFHGTNENNNTFLENNIENNGNSNQRPLIPENRININAIVSDTKKLPEDEKTKVSNLVNLLLKDNIICKKCVENTKEKNKIVLVYDASKKDNGNGYDLKSVLLKFSYCEQHQNNAKCSAWYCKKDSCYIMWCGHKICENCLKRRAGKDNGFVVCGTCNAVCCIFDYIDHFGTHLWCNAKNNRHYVCFKDKDGENPHKNKNGIYIMKTWVCHEHRDKKSNNQK